MSDERPVGLISPSEWRRPRVRFGVGAGQVLLLVGLVVIGLGPILWLAKAAITPTNDTISHPMSLFPHGFAFSNLRDAWVDVNVGYYFWNTIVIAAGASTLALWGAAGVDFDYNLLNLQAKGVESVRWEERILAETGRSGFTAFATASTLPELQRKQEAFARLSSVSKVESLLLLYPDQQAEKAVVAGVQHCSCPLMNSSMARVRPRSPRAARTRRHHSSRALSCRLPSRSRPRRARP